MGMILDIRDGEKVHAESRRQSFVLFTDFGEDRIELTWDYLDDLIAAAQALKAHHSEVAEWKERFDMPQIAPSEVGKT